MAGWQRCLAQRMVAIMDDPGSDHDIRTKMADAQGFLEALEAGNVHIGTPFEGRTEAKIQELRRQIAMYQSLIAEHQADGS
ncbi:MAG: hypothetical protein WBQ24_15575 [Xanthobacteraceae bacterium]